MKIEQVFLGFEHSALDSAVKHLHRRYYRPGLFDLERVAIVVPTSQALRRLRELLVDQAEADGAALLPPEIVTPGQLPELLYEPQRPFAGTLVQQLVWARVLRDLPTDKRSVLFAEPPANDDDLAWLDLGMLISRQHTELAGEDLDFAAVARLGETDAVGESERWQVLAAAQEQYHRALDGLELWDRQTARRVAVQKKECRLDRDLILLAATDIERVVREMLDQAADHPTDPAAAACITALVYAPRDWAERFDGHGCVDPAAWAAATIPFDDRNLHAANGATQQAEEVVRRIAAWNGEYRGDEITVGLPDERLGPFVARQLRQAGLPARQGAGTPLTMSAPCRLLEAAGRFASSGRYADFAALVRHPDVGDWLRRRGVAGDPLAALDEFYGEHFPSRIGVSWPGEKPGSLVRLVYEQVATWLKPLGRGRKSLREWRQPLLDLLVEIYDDRPVSNDPAEQDVWEACEACGEALGDFERVPEEFSPRVSASDAIGLVLRSLARKNVPPPADPQAIELLGWLELLLDDAEALVVAGLHDGAVPTAANSDLFLPNALRARLGVHDNSRRYARDAYATSVLAASGRRVEWIIGRRNVDDDPVLPSRLLFAADDETVVRRAQRFFGPAGREPAAPLATARSATRSEADFPIPLPDPARGVTSLSVTGFRQYLNCPYRFYLRRVLRLEAVDDAAEELDGAGFGVLLHETLQRFGAGPAKDSTDPETIRAALLEALADVERDTFGKDPIAAIRLQLEQVKARLATFANVQAEWAAAGWRIEFTEQNVPEGQAWLDVPDGKLFLTGRIDRIDVNQRTGERAILDYKTSEQATRPELTHRKRSGEWIDLQLPLYRHLAPALGLTTPVKLGYIVLPRDASQAGVLLAEWSDADLAAADTAAREVAAKVLAGVFWPPNYPADFADDLASICQDNVYGVQIPTLVGEDD